MILIAVISLGAIGAIGAVFLYAASKKFEDVWTYAEAVIFVL